MEIEGRLLYKPGSHSEAVTFLKKVGGKVERTAGGGQGEGGG